MINFIHKHVRENMILRDDNIAILVHKNIEVKLSKNKYFMRDCIKLY